MKHLLLSTLLLAAGPALAQQVKQPTTHHSYASYVAIFAALVAIFAALSADRKKRAQQQK